MQPPRNTAATQLPLSRAAIARNLGISASQVARIEKRALLKLRAAAESKGYSFRALISLISNPTDQP
jgi:DNA-directed RNA polymerase sigma subunit (sigma70/sigma32)